MSLINAPIEIDLTQKGEQLYRVPTSNRLWLPKKVLRNDKIFTNPLDCVLAIRFSQSSRATAWGLQDGLRNSDSADFANLFVVVLSAGVSARLCLESGIDVTGGYCSGDGLSPTIGGGSSSASASPSASTTNYILAGTL